MAVLLGISQTTAANASTSFIGRSQNNSDHPNTTVTLNTPTAIANGDLMLVFMVAWNSSPATPSNWTKLAAGVNSAVDGIFAYYKFWHIGDPSSYTFGGGSTNYPKAVMRVYRGVSSIDAASQAPVNAGSNTYGVSFYLPSLSATTTASEGYVGFYASPNTGGTISGPADLTDTITNQTQWASFDGDKQIANAGIIPPTEPALISTAGDWIGFDITLKPKASPTPTPTPTPTGTPTPTPTPIPTATASPTPTATFSPTPTPAPTSTPSPNPTPTSSPTPGGTFPQFGNTGQTLAGYTAGTSLFVRSMFGGDIFTGPYDTGYFNNIIPDVRAAQINTLESSFLRDATGNCISSNFALTGGGGTWQTNPCGNWHDAVVNGYFIPALKEYQTYGIPWLIRDDAIQHSSAPYYSCGSTIGSCINLWPEPLVADYTSILNSYANQYHMFVGQMSPDEFGNGSGNENGATSPYYSAWLRDLGMAGTGGQHVAYGEENLLGDTTNSTNPLYSDWYTVEVFDGNASWSNLVNNMHNGDQYKHIITAARGATAGMTVNSCEGPTYQKKTNDTQYTPGSDTLEGTWDTTWGAGAYLDLAMYAVAHGFAGIRTYQFDYYTAYQRLHDPIGTQNIETACSPVSAATGGKMAGGANGRGQDRWYAMSAAYNVIHAVEAYALQPTMAPPNQAQACDYDASVSTAGDPILCGAHQGNGGRLVVIMNVSPSASTFTFNPASYVYPGGTAQSWVLVGSTDGSCGEQTTTADAGVPGINDCVKGPTTINGVRWEQGTTMPAAGGAPTRTTNIGSCSGQMCPTEVDVFLYHQ